MTKHDTSGTITLNGTFFHHLGNLPYVVPVNRYVPPPPDPLVTIVRSAYSSHTRRCTFRKLIGGLE